MIIVINNNFPHLSTNDLYVEFIFLARELKPANIQEFMIDESTCEEMIIYYKTVS